MQKKPRKKTRDVNQLAKGILDAVTGEDACDEPQKDPAAVALGRKGGLKGGKARAASLTKAELSGIGKKAAKARWGKHDPSG